MCLLRIEKGIGAPSFLAMSVGNLLLQVVVPRTKTIMSNFRIMTRVVWKFENQKGEYWRPFCSFLLQDGHWKTENPSIIFPNKITTNLRKHVCKNYSCLISFSPSVATLYFMYLNRISNIFNGLKTSVLSQWWRDIVIFKRTQFFQQLSIGITTRYWKIGNC